MMRQLMFLGPHQLEWREAPTPRLNDAHDAIVQPLAVTRCDLDLSIARGRLGWQGPFAFGHETYGVVVDVGDSVLGFRPGDPVVVPFQLSCGACGRCQRGYTALCEAFPYRASYGMAPLSGIDYGGGLADRLHVPFADHMLVHAPPGLSPEALAGVGDNVTNAMALIAEPLQHHPGADVLIVAGTQNAGINLHLVQCALALGARRVVFAGSDKRALGLAARLGAELLETTLKLDEVPEGNFPVTIDASGDPDGLAFAIRGTAYEGICQRAYGDFVERTSTPLRDMYARHITLKLGRVHARAMIPRTLHEMSCGRLHPEHVISRRVTFAEAPDAMLDPTIKLVLLHETLAQAPLADCPRGATAGG